MKIKIPLHYITQTIFKEHDLLTAYACIIKLTIRLIHIKYFVNISIV